jgi:hypothetical protein
MFLAILVTLAVIGMYVMTRGRFEIGNREISNPLASRVGIVLIAQLPIALAIGIVVGLTGEPGGPAVAIPTRAGEPVAAVTVAPRTGDEHWWVDPLITCGAVVLAAGLTGVGLKSADETENLYASLNAADTNAAP